MAIEVERKFIIKSIPKNLFGSKINQGYLQSEKKRTVRIRTVEGKKNKSYITIKGASNKTGLSRYEFETEIPFDEGTRMLELCDIPLIEKTRYIYEDNNAIWEIDEFHGMNKGLLIAEIELSNENQKIELPDFIIEEVTGINKYYNSNLQKSPFTLWKYKFSK